jgi:hypothetical protein
MVLYAEANAEAYSGRFQSAKGWFRRAKEKSARNGYGAIPFGLQEEFAIQEAEAGKTTDARQLLPELVTESKDRRMRLDLAMLFARVGEVEKASALADALNREYPLLERTRACNSRVPRRCPATKQGRGTPIRIFLRYGRTLTQTFLFTGRPRSNIPI